MYMQHHMVPLTELHNVLIIMYVQVYTDHTLTDNYKSYCLITKEDNSGLYVHWTWWNSQQGISMHVLIYSAHGSKVVFVTQHMVWIFQQAYTTYEAIPCLCYQDKELSVKKKVV